MPNIQRYHLLFYKLSPQYCHLDYKGHMTIRAHDYSTTIAAIFDNRKKKLLSVYFGYVLKNQPVMVTSSVVCSYWYVIIKP